MSKQPLYPHVPKNREPLFPHVSRGKPITTLPEPLASEVRRELRKLTAWELQEAYDKLKMGEPTGIDVVDRHRDDALNAVGEALWERGKLSPYIKLSIPFAFADVDEIRWETKLEEKRIIVMVTNIVGLKQYELTIGFRDSIARISNLMVGYPLSFAGTARGRLWWWATINNTTVEVCVSNIHQLRQIQLENAFANSVAIIEEEGNPISKYCCRLCGECAPEELLEEGKFPERISWLRHHYNVKHPGVWGRGITERVTARADVW